MRDGPLAAIVRPFRLGGTVDVERLCKLAQYLVERRSDRLVVAGKTGESSILGDDERLDVFRVAVDMPGRRGTVVAGDGTFVRLTSEAHELGVDGFLVVTPSDNRPIDVRAVEQANDDLAQGRRILGEADLDLCAGIDNLILRFLELRQMIRSFREGDVETARRIDEELEPAYELLKVQTNPIPIKAALNLVGHDVGGLRLPLVQADESEIARVRSCLERLGVLSAAAV